MFGPLVLLFTIIPAIELLLIIKVGQYIGAINTLFLIIFTGVLGAYLANLQGFLLFQKVQDNLNKGIMPTDEMFDGLMILCGGVVLLAPGFITDALGLLLLIPITRSLIKMLVKKKFSKMMREGQVTQIHTSSRFQDDDFDDADFR